MATIRLRDFLQRWQVLYVLFYAIWLTLCLFSQFINRIDFSRFFISVLPKKKKPATTTELFERLPGELRNQIYGIWNDAYDITFNDPGHKRPGDNRVCWPSEEKSTISVAQFLSIASRALVFSKNISDEAMSSFFENNNTHTRIWEADWEEQILTAWISMLRNVCVNYSFRPLPPTLNGHRVLFARCMNTEVAYTTLTTQSPDQTAGQVSSFFDSLTKGETSIQIGSSWFEGKHPISAVCFTTPFPGGPANIWCPYASLRPDCQTFWLPSKVYEYYSAHGAIVRWHADVRDPTVTHVWAFASEYSTHRLMTRGVEREVRDNFEDEIQRWPWNAFYCRNGVLRTSVSGKEEDEQAHDLDGDRIFAKMTREEKLRRPKYSLYINDSF